MSTQARQSGGTLVRKQKPSIGFLIGNVVNSAKRQPERRHQIFGEAAVTFAGLAQDPQNAATAQMLETAALEFHLAASRPATDSDFHDLLRETAEAHAEVGPDADDTDLVARRREIHEARTNATHVSIAPRSINEDTPLGRVGTFKWNPSHEEVANGIKVRDTLAMWQGTKEESQAITVDAGIVQPPTAVVGSTPFPSARPYGLVDFGSDGSKIQVKFDVGFGTRFTLPANFVSVLIGMDPTPNDRPGAAMIIGASIGMFAAPSLAPVFCTQYVDGLPGMTSSELIPRPVKAVQLYWPMSSLLVGSVTYEFFDMSGSYLVGVITVAAATVGPPIPLSPDVAFVRIINNAVAAANFRLPFQLSL